MKERMEWSEAEAVVRTYRAERGAGSDVDVAALAQALGTDVAEVRRLAGKRRRFTDRSGVLSAMLAFGVFLVAILGIGPSLLTKNPLVVRIQPPQPTIVHFDSSYPLPPQFAERIDRTTAELTAPSFPGHTYRVRIVRTL